MVFLLVLLLFILFIPVLLLFGFFHVVTTGFEKLGVAPELVFLILILMFLGSFINIPLGRKRFIEVEQPYFFGLMRRKMMAAQGLSINVGGAVIPLIIAVYFLFQIPFQEVGIAIALMTALAYATARIVPNKGIALPFLLPPIAAAFFAFLISPEFPAQVAFVSGVFGVLIGADLLHLPKVIKHGQGMLSIGGAGVFDGIFLVAIISSLLASL
jgi:uncharacterized membrane protein